MFANRGWQKFALAINLLGSAMLFYSFQATSSNLKIVTTSDGLRTALCVDGRGLIVAGPMGGVLLGTRTCPEWENARPAAVVNIERPFFVTLGFVLITFGFLVQYLAVPNAKTIEELRAEMKAERQLQKIRSQVKNR